MVKKLTEQEIIEAFEICYLGSQNCEACPFTVHKLECRGGRMDVEVYKLLKRQKAEIERLAKVNMDTIGKNVELRTEMDKMVAEHLLFAELADKAYESQKDEIKQLKNALVDKIQRNEELIKDIERLMEERERVAWNKQEYLDWVHGLLSTHTEMKDRGEDYKMFDRDWLCDILWLKIEPFYPTIFDLERQRAELQKQVDELTAFKNEAISMSLYGKGRKDGEEVAVKDTAKEILTEIGKEPCEHAYLNWDCEWFDKICKKYGVEVE